MTSTGSWDGPGPDDITAWAVVQAGHLVGRRFHHAFAELGITPTQFGVLLNLDLRPDTGNAEMARTVLVTPQTMSELYASLQRLGLVERDPGGRGQRVTARLTPSGRELLGRCRTAVDAVQDSLGLSARDHDTLRRILHLVLAG